MRKFLLMLAVALASAAWMNPVSAYWTTGIDRLQPADVEAGQTIVIQATAAVKLTGYLGSWELLDQHLNSCLYEVESAGTNEYVNRPQFYFKQKTTGKYLGYNANEGYLVSSIDDAYKVTVWPATASEDEEGNVNATEARFQATGNSNWESGYDDMSVTLAVNVGENYMTSTPSMLSNNPSYSNATKIAIDSQYSSGRAWNLYTATEVQDADEELTAWMEYYAAKGYTLNSYIGGTTPGYYDIAAAAKYQAAFNAVTTAVGNTDYATAQQLAAALEDARANVDSTLIPITSGYYRFISAATQWAESDVRYAMYETGSTGSAFGMWWDTLDVKVPTFIFYVTAKDNGRFQVQGLRYGLYWNTLGRLPSNVDGKTETPADQIFEATTTAGQWYIHNSTYTGNYIYPGDYDTATEGQVYYGTSALDGNVCAWYLDPVNDQTLIDSLKNAIYLEDLQASIKDAAMAAQVTLDNTANVYEPDLTTPLIAFASSNSDDVSDRLIVSSVDETSASARAAAGLIDNNISTFWHTQWAKKNLDKHPKYNWIVAKLTEPVQQYVYRLQCRQDNNYNNWVLQAYIYGSDTEPDADGNADWVKLTELAITDVKATSNKSAITTSVIQLDKPYKYLKFYGAKTNNGSASNGLVAMQYAEFNMYPCNLNTDKSASQRADMQDAIKTFQDVINDALAKAAAGTGTQADLDGIEAAEKAYLAQYPDPAQLISEIKAAQTLVDRAVPDDDVTYGTVSAETLEALQNKILETVEDPSEESAYDKLYKLTRAEMDSKYNEIVALENALVASARTIKDGGIYYIKNVGNPSYDDTHVTNGAVVYTRGHDTGSALYWGGSVGEYEQNADAWWQAVQTGESTFAFRNIASGWYISEMTTTGKSYSLADTAVSFKVEYIGGAGFSLTPVVAAGKTAYKLHAQKAGYKVVGWNSNPVYNSACAWSFEDVEFDGAVNMQPFLNNSVQIVTLPYTTTELPSGNANVLCYKLVGVEADGEGNVSKIKVEPLGGEGLTAGTPFIMVVGDTTQYKAGTAAEDSISLDMHIDTENFYMSTEVKNDNGLIGAPEAKALKAAGYGYFDGRNLVATTDASATIAAQTGYINVASVEDKIAEAVEVLEISVAGDGVLNAIKKAVLDANATVDVYTVDGVLVKKNVKASAATGSLSKGIYIIGKKKVLVK